MPKLRRWHRWLIAAVVLAAAGVGGVAWWAAERRAEGARELARVTAELDASDPGWRYADLVAARNAALPPDEQNGTRVVEAVAARTTAFAEWREGPSWYGRDADSRPDPAKLDAARSVWKDSLDDIRLARTLRDRPRGGTRQTVPASPLAWPGSDALGPMRVIKLLHFDALVSALDGDPNQAIASLHAILHAGRAAAADGMLMGALVRTAGTVQTADGLRRVLAWSEPTAGLAELQAALAEEAVAPSLTEALRTERAWQDWIFDALANGTITPAQAFGAVGPTTNLRFATQAYLYRPHLTADHALVLKTSTRYVDATKRPVHEWKAAADAVPVPPTDDHLLISGLLLGSNPHLIADTVQQHARLRTALAALACERFRRANGRWPDALPDDLPAELRLDPHDGQPLRLKRLDDGLVVYSVGPEGTDDGGKLANAKGEKGNLDVGFRLWDPDRRKP